MTSNKHENYEILNLIGYGLAKFNAEFIEIMGFKTKTAFYEYVVGKDIASTTGTVKNRQDLFDPFFENGRKGWWQKGETYIHRKILIDSLYGNLKVRDYTEIIKIYLDHGKVPEVKASIEPVLKSKFKRLQETGLEAELFFQQNYKTIPELSTGILEDARLFGDGYDFQIEVSGEYFLTEVKGIRQKKGSFRMTKNEFEKAKEYTSTYGLMIVSNLVDIPQITPIFDPLSKLHLEEKTVTTKQTNYHSESIEWVLHF